jgi:hypothetical protein
VKRSRRGIEESWIKTIPEYCFFVILQLLWIFSVYEYEIKYLLKIMGAITFGKQMVPGENIMDERIKFGLLLLIVLSIAAVSCMSIPAVSSVGSHTEVIDLEDAESVTAEIMMGAGKLAVQSGTEALMEGEFHYSFREYAPDITYHVRSDGRGDLQVEQDDGPKFRVQSNYKNEWELVFNEEIPLDLDITLGAGESILDMADLNLESFALKMGAGSAYVDLSGTRDQDLSVNIQGGVGELTVLLPPETNIIAEVTGGLGEINTKGLYRDGELFVSKYSGSGSVVNIKIEAGIGQLNLLVQ